MIKIIAFDYGGVLVTEKDIELTETEDKIERFFGKNYSDDKFLNQVKHVEPNEKKAMEIAREVIDKLYQIKDKNLFIKLYKKYPDIKFCIATNHISYIENHIKGSFDMKYIDKIFVSAKMNKVKPYLNYYREIIKFYKLKPDEFLFVDDNKENVEGAKKSGMNAIKIDKKDDVFKKISTCIDSFQ